MANLVKKLDVGDIEKIHDSIKFRQEKFPEESLLMTVGIVLTNYGDKYVKVQCVNNEWSGTKGELESRDGVPHCPNGHVLFEVSRAPRLALIEEEK